MYNENYYAASHKILDPMLSVIHFNAKKIEVSLKYLQYLLSYRFYLIERIEFKARCTFLKFIFDYDVII